MTTPSRAPRHSHYDVIVVGAGLAGCATARALARADRSQRRRILVVDAHRDVHPRFSGELIHPRGAQILDDLGLFPALRDVGGVEVGGFAVYEHADATFVDLSYADVPNERPRGLAIHHKGLVRSLRQQIQRDHIELLEGWAVTDLRRTEGRIAGVVLQDPERVARPVSADLVVAADGKSSTVRKLAGISDRGRQTIGFTAGLEIVDASLPRPGYAHVFLGAWGPVLAYPIAREPDGTVRTRITIDLPRHLPAKGEALKRYLLKSYVPFVPAPLSAELAAAITRYEGPLPMAPTVNLPAPSAAMPGLALVGDSGGCSHPITASGMTMGLRDAETLGRQAERRADAPSSQMWLDAEAVRRYRIEHDRYVPTRQALADAIYEAFRGGEDGSRAIRRALFDYWSSGDAARSRSMALLSCSERRPHVFLTEYLKTARHALETSLIPQHASMYPVSDRVRRAAGAAKLASNKFGLVAQVMWAQMRPHWMTRIETR